MREFGKVSPTVWSSRKFTRLPDDSSKLLFLYCLTAPHSNSVGLYKLPIGYICEDLGWTTERCRKGIETLSKGLLIRYDEGEKTVWIEQWFRFNPPSNANHGLKCVRDLEALAPSNLRTEAAHALKRWSETVGYTFSKEFGNGIETLSKPFTIPDIDSRLDLDQTRDQRPDQTPLLDEQADSVVWPRNSFEQFWARYPNKVGKQRCEKIWVRLRKNPPCDFDVLIAALDRYIATKPIDREWCHPGTWLGQGRWEDDPQYVGLRQTANAPNSSAIDEAMRRTGYGDQEHDQKKILDHSDSTDAAPLRNEPIT